MCYSERRVVIHSPHSIPPGFKNTCLIILATFCNSSGVVLSECPALCCYGCLNVLKGFKTFPLHDHCNFGRVGSCMVPDPVKKVDAGTTSCVHEPAFLFHWVALSAAFTIFLIMPHKDTYE